MLPFISLEDFALYTGVSEGSLNPDRVNIALNAACQIVRTYVNRPLNLTFETVKVDGTGTDTLLLNGPLVDVDTLLEDDVAVEDDDYVVGTHALYRKGGGVWSRGRRNITLTYRHGYAIDETDVGANSGDIGIVIRMPDDIRQVALELADAVYSASTTVVGSGATTGYTVGPESYSEQFDVGTQVRQAIGGGLDSGQMARLKPYRYRPWA